jgi:hypothetical protein
MAGVDVEGLDLPKVSSLPKFTLLDFILCKHTLLSFPLLCFTLLSFTL